jgi:Ion channel
LSFSESIYFSIISISTVGYGDIVPHSSVARLLASIEVVCGFMLLLFGVSELLEYPRAARGGRQAAPSSQGATPPALKQRSGSASVMQSNGNVPVMSQSITRT